MIVKVLLGGKGTIWGPVLGAVLLFTFHEIVDMKVLMGLCETVFVLDHGEKLAEGPPGIIQTDERVIEAYLGR